MSIDTPTDPTRSQPRRLLRSRHDRVLGGVAGGLARYFSIDPLITRIAFAALVFAGGFGALAYVAAWLFVPDEETGETVAAGNRLGAVAGVIVLVVAVAAVTGGDGWLAFTGPGVIVLAAIAMLGYALWRAVGGDGNGSVLGRLVLVAVLGALALASMVAVAIVAALGGDTVIAGLVIAAGLLIAAGALVGRLRWLVIPALIVAAPAGVVAASDLDLSGGVGEREYRPQLVSDLDREYELGVGDMRIDLRDVELPTGTTQLQTRLGVGRILVYVPRGTCVSPHVTVGVGESRVLHHESAGVDVAFDQDAYGGGGRKRLVFQAEVGVGQVQMVYDESEVDDHDDVDEDAVRAADLCPTA